jgi:hypothetical protein
MAVLAHFDWSHCLTACRLSGHLRTGVGHPDSGANDPLLTCTNYLVGGGKRSSFPPNFLIKRPAEARHRHQHRKQHEAGQGE